MTREELIQQAKTIIENQLKGVEDLPPELANSVANIVFKYVQLFGRTGRTSQSCLLEKIAENPHLAQAYRNMLTQAPVVISRFEKVKNQINTIRDMKYDPPSYHESIQLLLDEIKYGIDEPRLKSELRRSIERRLRKPDEIGSLVEVIANSK